MAAPVTWDVLRDLAGVRVGRGRALSLYVNLDPSVTPTAGDIATRVRSLVADATRQLDATKDDLTHDERLALNGDLDRVATWLDDEFDRDGARGVAVFSSSLDGIWRTLALPDAVEDAVNVDRELYLAPLVPLAEEEQVLVAVVGRERGQVFRLRGNALVEIADETDEAPNRHSQGGWSQARYERHIEEVVARHLRQVSDTLERCLRTAQNAAVVLVSNEETRAEIDAALANDVRAAVVGAVSAEAHAGPAELLVAVEPVLAERRAAKERELLDRWRELAAKDARAASGWSETIAAASDARVDVLLVQEGVDRVAFRCPKCGRGEADAGSCPLDGTALEEDTHGLDLAVHQTLAHGGSVCVIRHQHDLEPVDGIGALLRF